jgi:hypothetical protein
VSLPEQRAFIDEFILQLARIRGGLVQTLIELFLEAHSWRDADADRFVARAVPLVEGAQRAAATLTDDFVGRVLADQRGEPFRPRGVDYRRVTGSAVRNGVRPEVVYRRPFEEVWRSLAQTEERIEERRSSLGEALDRAEALGRTSRRGVQIDIPDAPAVERPRRGVQIELGIPGPTERERKPLTAAVGDGERRVRSLALTDVELATTHTARERLADEPEVRFYRRVLTGAESCGLCIVASTQRYRKRDLLPIHPNCDCVVAPILGDQDPGRVINSSRVTDEASPVGETRSGVPVYSAEDLLDANAMTDDVHNAIRETFGEMAFDARQIDYRKILLVKQHGELGPVLTVKRHKFTKLQIDQRDLAATDVRRR